MRKLMVIQNKQSLLTPIPDFSQFLITHFQLLFIILHLIYLSKLFISLYPHFYYLSSYHCDLSLCLLPALVSFNPFSIPQLNCLSKNWSYPLETSKQNVIPKSIKQKVLWKWNIVRLSNSLVFPTSLTWFLPVVLI